MIRITNSMMNNNTKNNINLNKTTADKLNTMVATGQKITKPSDDPVIAIRALRLNTDLAQLNQYYDKNIPDSEAWMTITETALSQTDAIFTSIKENLTTGASDDNTASDRMKILESLKGLRDQIYSSGNADYADRTVFTGYRTSESLTYLDTDTDRDHEIMIHETFSLNDFDTEYQYIKSCDTSDPTLQLEQTVEKVQINRLRLAYEDKNGKLTANPYSGAGFGPTDGAIVIKKGDGSTPDPDTIKVTSVSITNKSQNEIDAIYTAVAADEAIMIPETGEVILGKDAMSKLQSLDKYQEISFEYSKGSWEVGDLRPEHYFACHDTNTGVYYNYDQKDDGTGKMVPDPTKPNFRNQDIMVEISYNQKIAINTHADEVFSHDIGRDVEDLIKATQAVVELDKKIAELTRQVDNETDPALKADLQNKLDAYNKEYYLKKDRMQKFFSSALTKFDGYSDKTNLAIANIGSMRGRLTVTKSRVADQLMSFKTLADENINTPLTDTAIDLKNAQLALEAAQMSSAKIAQQTLLNYL